MESDTPMTRQRLSWQGSRKYGSEWIMRMSSLLITSCFLCFSSCSHSIDINGDTPRRTTKQLLDTHQMTFRWFSDSMPKPPIGYNMVDLPTLAVIHEMRFPRRCRTDYVWQAGGFIADSLSTFRLRSAVCPVEAFVSSHRLHHLSYRLILRAEPSIVQREQNGLAHSSSAFARCSSPEVRIRFKLSSRPMSMDPRRFGSSNRPSWSRCLTFG
jgi:hypothetical protein